MNTSPKTIAITGINGYLGSQLARHLGDRGYRIVGLTRTPTDPDSFPFQLNTPTDPSIWEEVDLLIHSAWDFFPLSAEEYREINTQGSIELLDSAANHQVKILFVSSMSSFEGCRSNYGRAKLEVETHLRSKSAISLRPGLIYSDEPRGMLGSLVKLSRLSFLLPGIVGGSQILYLTRLQDLCACVEAMVTRGRFEGQCYTCAHPQPYTLREIIRIFSSRKRLCFFPVPWQCIWIGIRALEVLRIRSRLRSDSLISLIHQNESPDFNCPDDLFRFQDRERVLSTGKSVNTTPSS